MHNNMNTNIPCTAYTSICTENLQESRYFKVASKYLSISLTLAIQSTSYINIVQNFWQIVGQKHSTRKRTFMDWQLCTASANQLG